MIICFRPPYDTYLFNIVWSFFFFATSPHFIYVILYNYLLHLRHTVQLINYGITFSRPTALDLCPWLSALAPSSIYFSTVPRPNHFFPVPMYQIFFFTTLNYQNYYFTALLVKNIACISAFSRKIKNVINHMIKYDVSKKYKVSFLHLFGYFFLKRKCSKQNRALNCFLGNMWFCETKNGNERNNYFLSVCYFQQQEKCKNRRNSCR